jgi:hypothetical protein
MDIFLLFIFNIFTGAVIFLILSLKIEKTSSTFQEQKLRREMGEIITEFNSTAERNITLLENRISVLKKLLNENGSLRGIDFTVHDDKMKDNFNHSPDADDSEQRIQKRSIEKEKKKEITESKIQNQSEQNNIIGTFIDKIQSFNKTEESNNVKERAGKEIVNDYKKETEKPQNTFSIIEKEVKDINVKSSSIDFSADEEITLTYERNEEADSVVSIDIEELFHTTEDKYHLIAQLFNEGHSVEDLSKYSGIPAGEIKLVISLNS